MKQSNNAKIASTPRKRGEKNRVQQPRYCQEDRCFLSTFFFWCFLAQFFQSVCRRRYDLCVPHIVVICGASTTGFRFQTTCSSVGHLQPASAPPHSCVTESGGVRGGTVNATMPCGAEFTWSFTAGVAGVAGFTGLL
jgi:hypothetical protein